MSLRIARPFGIGLLLLLAPLAACGGGGGKYPLPPKLSATANLSPSVIQRIDAVYEEVEDDPDLVAPRLKLAATYEANRVPDLALETYEQIVAMDPEDPQPWYHLGRLRRVNNDTTGALEAFVEVERLYPDYAPMFWRRGQLLLELERLDEAQQAFLRAAQLDPTDPSGAVGVVEVALAREENDRALGLLEGLYERMADDRKIVNLYAEALRLTGQAEKAGTITIEENAPTRIYRKDPWLTEVGKMQVMGTDDVIALIDGRLQLGNAAGALELLKPAMEENPGDLALIGRATEAFVVLKDYDAALEMLNAAAVDMPDNFRIEHNRGVVLHYKGMRAEALEALLHATELAPAAGEAYFALARVQFDMVQLDSALASVDLAHENDYRAPQSVMLRGRILYQLRRIDEAIAQFQGAMEEFPTEVAPVAWLAASQAERGLFDEAEKTLEEVALRRADHPMIPQIRERMAVLRKSGQIEVKTIDPADDQGDQ